MLWCPTPSGQVPPNPFPSQSGLVLPDHDDLVPEKLDPRSRIKTSRVSTVYTPEAPFITAAPLSHLGTEPWLNTDNTCADTIYTATPPMSVSTSTVLSMLRKPSKRLPHLRSIHPTSSINHLAHLEPVKLTRSAHGVRSHVVKPKPVPNLQRTRQSHCRTYAVDRVTSRAPHTARMLGLQRCNVE
jgi:hypothetical protein